MDSEGGHNAFARGPANFRTTHWSVVLLAGQEHEPNSAEALEQLCRAYWPPIYAFVRRRGYTREEAEDLVQGFFSLLLARKGLERVDPARGRFRSFLLASVNNYLANEHERATRQKRGGGCETFSLDAQEAEERYAVEPVDDLTPERLFERRWAETVFERIIARLQAEFAAVGQAPRFECLKPFLLGEPADFSYADVAQQLGLSVSAVTSAIHRMRARYREIFREEIAQTVGDVTEVEDEIRYLVRALSG